MLTRDDWDCPREYRLRWVLSGGDDYELVFTASPSAHHAVESAALNAGTRVTRIGRVTEDPNLLLVDDNGDVVPHDFRSFDHFA
jgi:thiamine-monophosphate kinase